MTVELDFDFAGAARKIAGCTAREFLHEVAHFTFGLEGGRWDVCGGGVAAAAGAAIGDLF